MANEFDKRYDALVEEMKAAIKELLCKIVYTHEHKYYSNSIIASSSYWNIMHVIEEGEHESLDVVAHTYYMIDDMIMASEQIPLGLDDIYKYDDMDIARENHAPSRGFIRYHDGDIELTSYEHLSLAYDNIKYVVDHYLKDNDKPIDRNITYPIEVGYFIHDKSSLVKIEDTLSKIKALHGDKILTIGNFNAYYPAHDTHTLYFREVGAPENEYQILKGYECAPTIEATVRTVAISEHRTFKKYLEQEGIKFYEAFITD